MKKLILASASPQRAQLLKGLGLDFTVVVSSIDEDAHPEMDPVRRAQVLADLKARDIANKHPGTFVLGCDTLVEASDGTLLEKPKDAEDAERMLKLQSGKTSKVHSALCLIDTTGTAHGGISTSLVTFRTLTETDRAWWLTTNLWNGRSGGFQIDGSGQLMIQKIEGDWSGVVGLPVFVFGQLCSKAKFDL